jgi:hypothetical protein
MRFVAPVFIGDTITVHYRITRIDPERHRSYGSIVIVNQHRTEVAVAEHILKWVPVEEEAPKSEAEQPETAISERAL